jgi:thioredoxin-related protein
MIKFSPSIVIAVFLLVFSANSPVFAEDGYKFVEIKQTRDLAVLAEQSRQHQRAILLMFSGNSCRFCTIAEEDYLKPMLRSGEYDTLISMHKVRLDSDETLIDFDGKATTSSKLAKRYGVFVMPTIIFVDAQGKEVAEKRVGVMTEAYYAGYLDDSIRTAHAALGRP